jgi:N-acetylneuraminate synthase
VGPTVTAAVEIAGRPVGPGHPVLVVAELSANHGGRLATALDLVAAAADAGADAVKLQTYTADTMTLNAAAPAFVVGAGSPWTGRRLHELYAEAETPWEWHPAIAARAAELGLAWLSTPFDLTAVAFLDGLDVPALKIASFELTDLALIAGAAATGRPLIVSTGMGTEDEIDAAVAGARSAGCQQLILLRCSSAYPSPPDALALRSIPYMAERWSVPVGFSDHTLSNVAAVAAVALGAVAVEKHLTLRRADGGPDAAFSAEPGELAQLVESVRQAERALGRVRFGPSEAERSSLHFRRSLWFVEHLDRGAVVTDTAVRVLRPADGLAPAELPRVLGRRVTRPVEPGTAVDWSLLE